MSAPDPDIAAAGPALTAAERRLAESRAALVELVRPARSDEFPRSETMRFVMGGKGKIVAIGLFAGLLVVKPQLAVRLVGFLPLGKLLPVGRMLQLLR